MRSWIWSGRSNWPFSTKALSGKMMIFYSSRASFAESQLLLLFRCSWPPWPAPTATRTKRCSASAILILFDAIFWNRWLNVVSRFNPWFSIPGCRKKVEKIENDVVEIFVDVQRLVLRSKPYLGSWNCKNGKKIFFKNDLKYYWYL